MAVSVSQVPQVGEAAPTFRATASTGPIDLADFKGKKPLVLYFYPRADTPGCTKEACAFRDLSKDFQDRGVAVVGVSADDVGAQQGFAAKFRLGFPLIADPDHRVLDAYGVWGGRTRADGT